MSNTPSMDNEITRLARRLVESIDPNKLTDYEKDIRERILVNTTPLTMAGVNWDDDKHRLAGATTQEGTDVVMMWYDAPVEHIVTDEGTTPPDWLTPNGKRYELREVENAPEHPDVLTTMQDYMNAPEGTIVAQNNYVPHVKSGPDEWVNAVYDRCSNAGMAGAPRKVLRWRWGKK